MTTIDDTVGQSLQPFEIACRAIVRIEAPYPTTPKNAAKIQAYIDANWSSLLPAVTAGYMAFLARQRGVIG